MNNLKPCPFCGSSNVGFNFFGDRVVCNDCDDAVKAESWNARAPDPALAELETWLENRQKLEGGVRLQVIQFVLAKLRELKSDMPELGEGE